MSFLCVITKTCVAMTGSLDVPSFAMELDLARAGMHLLVEKPISMRPAEEVHRLAKVLPVILIYTLVHFTTLTTHVLHCLHHWYGTNATSMLGEVQCYSNSIWHRYLKGSCCQQELDKLRKEKGLTIAVGYMLRYNPAIEAAQALLKEVLHFLPLFLLTPALLQHDYTRDQINS